MVVEGAKHVAQFIGMERNEMQDPTGLATTQLFDKSDEVLKQSYSLKTLLCSIFEGMLQYQNECLKSHGIKVG